MKKVEESRRVFEETSAKITFTDSFIIDPPCVVCADLHIPFHDVKMLTHLIRVAETNGVRRLAIIGDLMDMHFLAGMTGKPSAPEDVDGKESAKRCENILLALLNHFDEIFYVPGNHDKWVARILDNKLPWERIARMFTPEGKGKFIKTSRYHHCLVGEWCCTHPKNYSVRSTTVPKALVEKKGRPVIVPHQHTSGMEFERGGRIPGVAMGAMCDAASMLYLQEVDSTNPKWQNEFGIIDGSNVLHRFIDNKYLTDWKVAESVRVIR
jgi:hypothetical protein